MLRRPCKSGLETLRDLATFRASSRTAAVSQRDARVIYIRTRAGQHQKYSASGTFSFRLAMNACNASSMAGSRPGSS